jgi:16S rRNA (adenine1518-N6/adenine1519-N6)-dimethyltransferase
MPSVSEIRQLFREYGLAPKKWMGQNLLVDPRYLTRIGETARIEEGEPLVEIGAGLGFLTEELRGRGAKIYALEIDSGFFRVLQERFSGSPFVELIHADALKYDFHSLRDRIGKLRVVANLPYNISSRLLFTFFRNSADFSSLHILLQKEVAHRLLAEPGSKEYGVLTVVLAAKATADILFDIPPRAFFPVPEITSSLVRVTFPDPPPLHVTDAALFERLVKISFAGRRKTLRNNLRAFSFTIGTDSVNRAAEESAIDLSRRGETLSPEEFVRFAEAIHRRAASLPHPAEIE